MQNDLNHYVRRKKKLRRVFIILLITIAATVIATSMQECSQKFQQPYNKDYKPLDQNNPKPR